MAHRVSTITLKNFKAFYGDHILPVERKNILIYGENGSGKSSLYWSLYTFLQSVFKEPLEIRKYFDPKHSENLRNRYADDAAECAIILDMEDEAGATDRREISLARSNTRSGTLISETTLGSDFIEHKVLSQMYAYYHKKEIDLFDFFERHMLAFINFREDFVKPGEQAGSPNAKVWWDYFKMGLPVKPKMHEQPYKDFQTFIRKFNSEFEYYLINITDATNKLLEDSFKENFRITLAYRRGTYNDFWPKTKSRSWQVKAPKLVLSVTLTTDKIADENKKKIDSPQSFLNEAKLSSLALAIRLAILDEKFVAAYPKILVLDDMLMSMDMSNREFVLNMLLERYIPDYQILFFTHQRGLFEDARKAISFYYSVRGEELGWQFYEMYETETKQGIPVPNIQLYESSLQKALKYFTKEYLDYNACGNNLRTALEEFFVDFIPAKYLNGATMLAGLIVSARTYFAYVGFETVPLDRLDRYRERSLNPTSHYNPRTDYFKRELQDIFSILDGLKRNKNDVLLGKDNQIKFEIKTTGGKSFAYTAILLDDIRLYQKNDNSPSFFKDADDRGYVMVSYAEDGNTTALTHEINRCTLQKLYDDTITFINHHNAAIVETNMYTVFTDQAGAPLESLKPY